MLNEEGMKVVAYLILFLFIFSFSAFSLEITDDLFIESEGEENLGSIEEIDQEEIQSKDIKKTYKKEKVIIKRELSSLDIAVEEVAREDTTVNSSFELEKSKSKDEVSDSERKKTSYSLDYGEYEVHWSKK